MKTNEHKRERHALTIPLILVILMAATILLIQTLPRASANPAAVDVTNYSTETKGVGTGGTLQTARGTISTILLNATQQDQYWKAYVGNVTGKLTLDDADGNTIYDWSVTGVTITGEVYVTRTAISFTGMECANETNIGAEELVMNMTGGEADSINKTFSNTTWNHSDYRIGDTTIENGTCRAVATYIANSSQTLNSSAYFQELVLQDTTGSIVFMTNIEDDLNGYDNNPFDFQIIVPESDINANPTTYYFYTEISTS